MMMTMMHQKPTVDMPPWLSSLQSDPSCYDIFQDQDLDLDLDLKEEDDDFLNSACDEFRMYEFKIRKCAHGRSHDWTECPFAHPGEKARRRDPRKYHYSGTACADFRKGSCRKGDGCELSHGVFELWLHPARYRTQPCKDGIACRRRVCFFAHTPDQLRVLLPQSPKTPLESFDGSPMRMMMSAASSSPPVSPTTPSTGGRRMMNEVVSGMMNLQLGKVKPSMMRGISCGLSSLPSTPTKAVVGGGFVVEEDEDEVVESGRALREKMYERFIRKENDKGPDVDVDVDVDVGWVSELVM